MGDKTDLSIDDRLWVLEAQVREQEAQIDCLVKVVTELVAALSAHSGDLGLIEALGAYAKTDQSNSDDVERLSQKEKFFAVRRDLFEMIYNDAKQNEFFLQKSGPKLSTDS